MDISKIRKKAKQQAGEVQAAEKPAPADEAVIPVKEEVRGAQETEPAAEIEAKAETIPIIETASLSRKVDPQTEDAPLEDKDIRVELLTFNLGSEEFSFKVPEVVEIIRLQKMTRVPTMPDYVIGITSLRGKIIPVIDLKSRLGLGKAEQAPEPRPDDQPAGRKEQKILIVSGPKGMIGAMIDKVSGVVGTAQDKILEPPAHLTEADLKYIEGIVILDKKFISVLRTDETMTIED
jgi:purine-binding chemotaxis protein CheW